MKVLNLRCAHSHSFEGWFGSEDDFQSQLSRGLIECPLCADKQIQKLPSAPRLNLGGHSSPESASARASAESQAASPANQQVPASGQAATGALVTSAQATATGDSHAEKSMMPGSLNPAEQAAFMQVLREVVSKTEDVGQRFAEEARRMHYGEAEERSIRGQASVREAVELLEEGIEVLPLPMLPALKETLQ
jgi:hypothetical protein